MVRRFPVFREPLETRIFGLDRGIDRQHHTTDGGVRIPSASMERPALSARATPEIHGRRGCDYRDFRNQPIAGREAALASFLSDPARAQRAAVDWRIYERRIAADGRAFRRVLAQRAG